MTWLWAALAANLIFGTSAVIDKALLKRRQIDPSSYTFWLAILGIFAFLLAPFGFELLPFHIFLEAMESGVYFIAAMFLLFSALSVGEASIVLMLTGALTPIFTLLIGIPFGQNQLTSLEFIGFILLVVGGVLIYGAEHKDKRRDVVLFSLMAALFFALSTITAKIVYSNTAFINGFIWIKIGGIIFALAALASSKIRDHISRSFKTATIKNKTVYFLNRGYVSIGALLISYAISLGHPALVEATGSFKYVVIFVAAWLVLKERFSGKILWKKIGATVLAGMGIVILTASSLIASVSVQKPKIFGATFAPFYAEKFGLDWKENYLALFDDLGVKHVRLLAYWNEIEPENDKFNFSRLDFQVLEAEKRGVEIILAVGYKLPRWPECHFPAWLEIPNYPSTSSGSRVNSRDKIQITNKFQTSNSKFQDELLEYEKTVIERYKTNSAIKIWQIENEPFLPFGEGCPEFSSELLDKEITLVKSLDDRPVMITDSGEFSIWIPAARRADIFGSTLYRVVWNDYIGHFTYPLRPSFFRLKRAITETFIGKKPLVIIELQGESWQKKMTYEVSVEEQYLSMNPEVFRDTLAYIEGTGFDTFYLWGVEWWYWLKTTKGDSRMWDIAKEAIKKVK